MSRFNKYLEGQTPEVAAPGEGSMQPSNRFAKYLQDEVTPPPTEGGPGLGQKLGRQAGIDARAAITGLSFPVSLLADTAVHGINAIGGTNLPKPSEGFQDSLTRMGLPVPQNAGERLASDIVSGASGAALSGPVAALSGATGNFSAGAARELGGGLTAQIVTGIIGGMAPTNAANTLKQLAKLGYKATRDLINPANREIIGKILVENADNPQAVIAKLGQPIPEYVPGSKPTLGEVAGDNRLTASQAAFENANPGIMAEARQNNTAARNAYLEDIAGSPMDLANAKTRRASVTGNLRSQAFANKAGDTVDPKKVIEVIDQRLASPEGNLSDVQLAMNAAKARIAEAINIGNPEYAYALRRDLADDISGRLAQKAGGTGFDPKKYQRLAAGHLSEVVRALDDEIEKAAPGYKNYMQRYSEMSQPVNQLDELQALQEAAFRNQPFDTRGNQAMRPSVIEKALSVDGRARLAKVLTPEQMKRLDNLQKDMQRQSVMRSVRPAGSNTAANLKASEQLNAVIDDVISNRIDSIPLVGRLLKASRERAPERGLGRAYSDPEEARQAMIAALRELQSESMPAQMKRVALKSILGTSIGLLTPRQGQLIMQGEDEQNGGKQ